MATQKIFFSYSRVDGSAFARKLAVDLKANGFDVWIDQEDIRAGLDWDTEIEKALESCDYLLFLETEKSVSSKNVLDEVYYALDQNKKVIPLICVDSKTPYRLNRLQHIDFSKDYSAGLAQLIAELEGRNSAIAYPTESSAQPSPQAKPHEARSYKTSWIIGGLVLLLIAAFAIILKKQPEPSAPKAATEGVQAPATNSPETAEPVGERAPSSATEPKAVAVGADEKEEQDEQTDKRTPSIETRPKGITNRPMRTSNAQAMPLQRDQGSVPEDMDERVAGDWALTGVQPKAASQSGYLKIEALGENKATMKAYIQFYYPDREAPPQLTVFNSFVGCVSCVVKKEMKLKVEDIAVATSNANKSVYGKATLEFVNDNTAIIKVIQSNNVELSNGATLEPFVYTFRFSKRD